MQKHLFLAAFMGLCLQPAFGSPATTQQKSPFLDDQAECKSFSNLVTPDQENVIGPFMAQHMHRLNHVLWHATRNAWSSLTADEQHAIEKLSDQWGKNKPVCPMPEMDISGKTFEEKEKKERGIVPSGEEFLLMHHEMVDMLRVQLVNAHVPCIAGWQKLPKKDDKNWPVPDGAKDDESKTDDTGAMMDAWRKKFDDPAYLKDKSLSWIGYMIENSIHNNMHMRWAPTPGEHDGFSPLDGKKVTLPSLVREYPYDDPKYHWLGNPYSAHVNSIFWKLHGWVDSVIPKWLAANGYDVIALDCKATNKDLKKKCYEWKSQWVGGLNHIAHTQAMVAMAKGMKNDGPLCGVPSTDQLTGEDLKKADDAISKIIDQAGFSNKRFHDHVFPSSSSEDDHQGKSLSDKVVAPAQRDTTYDDPFAYVKAFGPCSAPSKK